MSLIYNNIQYLKYHFKKIKILQNIKIFIYLFQKSYLRNQKADISYYNDP